MCFGVCSQPGPRPFRSQRAEHRPRPAHGIPDALLLDNGFLTELRTGAAGALAADLLARPDADSVAVIGTGSQARFQIDALIGVRPIADVRVLGRDPARALRLAAEVRERHRLASRAAESVRSAVAGTAIVVTTSPATDLVLHGAWLQPGMHVTAVGADMAGKRELDADALRRADVVAVDLLEQARTQGEVHHGLRDGVILEADVVTLGDVLAGASPGRRGASDVTVADL